MKSTVPDNLPYPEGPDTIGNKAGNWLAGHLKNLAETIQNALKARDEKQAADTAVSKAADLGLADWLSGVDARTPATATGTDYAQPFVDSTGSVAGGVLADGSFNFAKVPRLWRQPGVILQPVVAPGWAVICPDKDGSIAFGIRDDGRVYAPKLETAGGGGDASSIANTIVGLTKPSRTKLTTIGDSLTYGFFGGFPGPTSDAWPAKLQALAGPGVAVTNLALSGYTVDEISIRVGALPVPLTVSGGQIPSSGPVTVTTTQVIGWRPSGTGRSFPGSLAGIPGTLTRTDSDTSFTFTRTTSGTARSVPAGTVFKSDFDGHGMETVVLMIGINNVVYNVRGADSSVAEHVVKGIRRIYNWLVPQVKQLLVMSVTTTTNWTNSTGSYAVVKSINTQLAAEYPTRFYDLRAYLVTRAIYDLGITPTAADLTKMAEDTLPPSIMDPGSSGTGDSTHYSKAVHQLVGQRVFEQVTTRDWIAA